MKHEPVLEPFGERLGALRVAAGLTQAALARRIAVSRVAISHVEAGLVWPNERTVLLLAGVLRIEPPDLVKGTNYPVAKSERIPAVAMRFSKAEMDLALLERDLSWMDRLDVEAQRRYLATVIDSWQDVAASTRAGASDDDVAQRFVIAHGALLDRHRRLADECQ